MVRRADNGNLLAGTSRRRGVVAARLGNVSRLGLYSSFRRNTIVPVMTFSPTQLTGLIGWWEADSVVSAAGLVSQVTDKSGNNNNLVQATGANQPTLAANNINGRPALLFAGSHWLLKEDGAWAFSGGASSMVLATLGAAAVANCRIMTSSKVGSADNITDGYYILIRPGSVGNLGPGITGQTAVHIINYDEWVAIDGVRNQTDINSYLNGGDLTTKTGAANIGTLPRLALGTALSTVGAAVTTAYTGKWAVSLLYNRPLTLAEMQKLQGWVQWRYGMQTLLPADHPYKTIPPMNSVVALPPVNTVLPAITPTTNLNLGTVLTCSNGTWSNTPTSYSRVWKADGTPISGATGTTYTLTAAEHNKTITCTVAALNAEGSSSADATGVGPAFTAAPVNTAASAVTSNTGFAEVGAILSTNNGSWTNSPTGYAYQWKRDGTNIAGATASTYTLVTADAGTSIQCFVTATNVNGSTAGPGSNTMGPVLTRRMTPSDIAGIVSWYDPNDPAGLVQAGGFVSQLTDLSGNGKHFVQATGANQPTTAVVNGKTRLALSGAAQHMSTAVFTALANNTGYVLAALASYLSGSISGGRILVGSNTSGADVGAGAMRIQRNGVNAQTQVWAGTGTSTPVLFGGITYGTEHLYVGERISNTTLRATVDGGAVATGLADPTGLAWTRLTIGTNMTSAGSVGSSYLQGNIGPMACFNVLLSDTDRQKLEGILAWLAGFQASLDPAHPYLTSPPRI